MSEWENDMDLSDLEEAYMQASDSSNPPDDTYETEIVDAGFKRNAKGERKLIVVRDVLSGDYAGRKIWNPYSLAPTVIWKLKRDVSQMGLPPFERLAEVQRYLDEFIGLQHVIRLFKRPDKNDANKLWPDFEIVKVLRGPGGDAEEPGPSGQATPPEDDIPF